jgi:short-subunit dehydrogenase
MPTVLIVGATGNIGSSAVLATRKLDYHVLAVVRDQKSAEKLFAHVGSSAGITAVEADILSDNGVKYIVERVRQGELPAFQHVYAAGRFGNHLST